MKLSLKKTGIVVMVNIISLLCMILNLKGIINKKLIVFLTAVLILLHVWLVITEKVEGLALKNKSLLLFSGLTKILLLLGTHIEYVFKC